VWQVLSFPYDIYMDTIDDVAGEMQKQFALSDTDKEIAASSMREVMALQVSPAHRPPQCATFARGSLRV
jgi:hypothetical protein